MAEKVTFYVLSDYHNRDVHYAAGTTIEVDPEDALFLQRDAPGCFAPIERGAKPVAADIEAPPVDKMVKKPAKKK